ncbi:MAG: PAS domain-containing protein [Methylobacter sp.]|uniref:GAF domain-containing protein n=1 Tax=Methylobacter sp. TaxID=2051955 RepID=UPI002730BAD6|nr:PAS domain-containing protein [Methylobacter sp.]MDP1664661.1 PAS domain-containing protein [Methylobacter sp.]
MSHKNNNKLIGLEDLLKFQSLLAELSAKLIRVSPDMVDHEIQEGLCRIAENLDLDSVSIGLLTADGQDFYSRYQYSKTSVKAWQDASLMAEGPLLTQTILAGKPFIMHDVDKLPPEGAVDRESFLRYGIRANLAFPFIVGGRLCGGIGFASIHPRQWHDDVVRGLGLMSDGFANVLERQYAVQALQSREEQMRLAADAANVGLWVWNIRQDTIWVTDRARKLYGIEDHDTLNLQRFLDCLHPEDKQRVRETLQRILPGESELRDEYRVVHPDASEHWICASGRCLLGADGQWGPV